MLLSLSAVGHAPSSGCRHILASAAGQGIQSATTVSGPSPVARSLTVAPLALASATLAARRLRQKAVRRRGLATVVTAVASASVEAPVEQDKLGRQRLQYLPDGWNRWDWKPTEAEAALDEKALSGGSLDCGYIVSGPADGVPVVCVHGFGASSYHWRYQVPALAAAGYRVYALDLLGYGWSPRKVVRYSGEVWATQINAFVRDVVKQPAVFAGNSVGAFASLIAGALDPDLCRGLVLLNAAGRFEERQPDAAPANKQVGDIVADAAENAEPGPIQWVLQSIGRAIANWAFLTTKLRIQPILEWVYVNDGQVDDELVSSIRTPADHPDALDTFAEVIQAGRRTEMSVFQALDKLPLTMPVLLLWGMQDPWMRPERAAAIRSECASRGLSCDYVEIDAGHCPQDDTPDVVNEAMVKWLKERESASVDTAVATA